MKNHDTTLVVRFRSGPEPALPEKKSGGARPGEAPPRPSNPREPEILSYFPYRSS